MFESSDNMYILFCRRSGSTPRPARARRARARAAAACCCRRCRTRTRCRTPGTRTRTRCTPPRCSRWRCSPVRRLATDRRRQRVQTHIVRSSVMIGRDRSRLEPGATRRVPPGCCRKVTFRHRLACSSAASRPFVGGQKGYIYN